MIYFCADLKKVNMSNLKKLSAIVLVALFAFCITGCNKKKDYSEQLVGIWYEETENSLFTLALRDDMAVIELSYSAAGVSQNRGTYSSDGNELTLVFNETSNTYKFEFNGDKLIVEYPDATRTFSELDTSLDLVGNWTVDEASTIVVVKPLKDELSIPGGVIVDGHEVPFSIPTSTFSGQFVKYALQQYLQNISFTENTLSYNVISRESETPVNITKTYTKEYMGLKFSGKVMDLDVDTKIFAAQPESKDQTMLVFDKENATSMLLGYCQLVGGSSLSSQPFTREQYESFKKEIAETFESLAIIIYLNRVK